MGCEAIIEKTLAKDPAKNIDDAFMEIHKRLRDGDLATPENAKNFHRRIFAADRYDLSKVGRFRFNKRFSKDMSTKEIERKTISLTILQRLSLISSTLNSDPEADGRRYRPSRQPPRALCR